MQLQGGIRTTHPCSVQRRAAQLRQCAPAAAATAAMSGVPPPGSSRPTSPQLSQMSWRNPTVYFSQAASSASAGGGGAHAWRARVVETLVCLCSCACAAVHCRPNLNLPRPSLAAPQGPTAA